MKSLIHMPGKERTGRVQTWSMLFAVLTALYLCFGAQPAVAQFSGTVGIGLDAATNVEGIDTAAPDRILQPAITLEYSTEFSPIAILKFDAEYNPFVYTVSPVNSYTTTSFGISTTIYTTNQDAIREAWEDDRRDEEKAAKAKFVIPKPIPAARPVSIDTTPKIPLHRSPSPDSLNPPKDSSNKLKETGPGLPSRTPTLSDDDIDSIAGDVADELYDLSESVDSLNFANKSNLDILHLKDSVSDALSTLGDVLDSLPYTASLQEVLLDEMSDIEPSLKKLAKGKSNGANLVKSLQEIENILTALPPEGDYLATKQVPIAQMPKLELPSPNVSKPQAAAPDTTKHLPAESPKPNVTQATILKALTVNPEDYESKAPLSSLFTGATSQFRDLTSQDFDIRENITPQSPTTFASSLQLPFTYELDRNRPEFNIYDYNALTLEGTYEGSTSELTTLDFTYDFINSRYDNDSIFTNMENRARLGVRTLVTSTTMLFAEGIMGFKDYSTAIVYPDTVTVKKVKKVENVTLTSSFQIYVFGLGLEQFIGKDVNLGGIFDFSTSPNLRVFLDQLPNRARQQAANITDDPYTYNMQRLMVFGNVRIFGDLDFGLDATGEHRKYGSLLKKDGPALIAATGADRSESDVFINANLSKTFYFVDGRALSVFDLIMIQAALQFSNVNSTAPSGATLPLYSYRDTEVTLTFTLGF